MSSRSKKRTKALKRRVQANASECELRFAAGDLSLEAADDGPPSFSMVAYNGGLLNLGNHAEPVVIDLKSANLHGGAENQPILRDHDVKRPIGHGSPRIGSKNMTVNGVISQTTADAAEVVSAAKNGYPWQASIGGRTKSPPRLVPRGRSVTVNGRTFNGPVRVGEGFTWAETSITAIGADAERATTVIAANKRGNIMDQEFLDWLLASGWEDPDSLTEDQRTTLKAHFDAQRSDDEADTAKAELAAIKADQIAEQAEAKLVETTNRVFRANELAARYQSRLAPGVLDPLHQQALSGDITPEKFELELVKAVRPSATASALSPSYQGADANTITAALALSCGVQEEVVASHMKTEVGPEATERAMNQAYPIKDYGLHKLVHSVLASNGQTVPAGAMMDGDILAVALNCTPARTITASTGFSTISLPGILSRVANKAMLQAYGDYAGVARRFCAETDTTDLKEFDRFRMTESGLLEEVPDTGEITHSSLTEEKHTNRVRTYARMFSITEAMFINDDLGAMMQIPQLIGRMSAHTLETHVFELLVSLTSGATGTEFFTSSTTTENVAPNYLTGAGSALDLTSLGDAYKLFLDQIDSDGKPIMVEPALLLVANKNAVNAGKLYNDSSFRLGSSTGNDTLIDNQWQDMFSPIVSPHLGRSGTPNEDQWYLLPNPSDTAVLNIAYLRGQRVPTISQADADFNKLGVQMRGVFRFGVAAWDRRLAVKSDGK